VTPTDRSIGQVKEAFTSARCQQLDSLPGEAWHTCLFYVLQDNHEDSVPPHKCIEHHPTSRHAETLADWLRTVAKIQTSNEEFYRLFRSALEDMAALRLPIEGTDHTVFLPAAGLPWFIAPFGRDSLIVSLQNILIYPEFARGSLDILGSLQAKEDDPYRDAEPGKIFHELRYGELAHFKLIMPPGWGAQIRKSQRPFSTAMPTTSVHDCRDRGRKLAGAGQEGSAGADRRR
jgi:glycogen debranching enzyme